MADTATSTGADGPEGETPTQRQARLRREKRQKKMAEQGDERLAKIKALNGGVAPPEEVLGGPTVPGPKSASVVDDPDEVDISSYANRSAPPQDNPLAAAMLQMQQQQQQQARSGGPAGGEDEDPMVRMMQQMMGLMGGGAPGQQQGADGGPGADPQIGQMLQQLMSGGGSGPDGAPAQQASKSDSAYLWRLVHALFALILAGYVALTSTFNGTALSRTQTVYTQDAGYGVSSRLFLLFTSAELVLQSTRYYVEGGRLHGGGILATVANSGLVPPPYANYIRIVGRYIGIAQTIFSDAMVVVFVLGCMAWWHDLATPL